MFSTSLSQSPSFHLALQQAVALLQMPRLELAAWVEEEVEKNPLLELISSKRSTQIPLGFEAATPLSREEMLHRQIRELLLSSEEQKIAEKLVGLLDEKGFLSNPLDLLFVEHDPLVVRKTVSQLQTLDPPGIFAASLQEALLLQLKRKGLEKHPCYFLVEKQFDLLIEGKWKTLPNLQEAIQLLSELSLRPTDLAEPEKEIWIRPDLTLEKQGDLWSIRLDEEEIPLFQFNPLYEDLSPASQEEASVLRAWRSSAKWLIRSLRRRKQLLLQIGELLLKVHGETLEHQKAFSPISMKKGAEILSLHVSTFSRALCDKYVQTPQGIFPLKFFFSENSQQNVKEVLKQLIAEEDKQKPLSDEELSKRLISQGFSVARRTVVKYRTALTIPSAKIRRLRNQSLVPRKSL